MVSMNDYLFYIFWLGSILGLIGTLLNARHNKKAFIVWMVSNTILIYQNITLGAWNQVFMLGTYLALAVYGWVFWNRLSAHMVDLRELPSDIQNEITAFQKRERTRRAIIKSKS